MTVKLLCIFYNRSLPAWKNNIICYLIIAICHYSGYARHMMKGYYGDDAPIAAHATPLGESALALYQENLP